MLVLVVELRVGVEGAQHAVQARVVQRVLRVARRLRIGQCGVLLVGSWLNGAASADRCEVPLDRAVGGQFPAKPTLGLLPMLLLRLKLLLLLRRLFVVASHGSLELRLRRSVKGAVARCFHGAPNGPLPFGAEVCESQPWWW